VERATTTGNGHQQIAVLQDRYEDFGGRAADRPQWFRNSDWAHDAPCRKEYSVLSQARVPGLLLSFATWRPTGGNLLQRTSLLLLPRQPIIPANNGIPGRVVPRSTRYNRMHAVLGTSEHCIRHASLGHGSRDDGT